MTDQEYAICIYCRVFRVKDDGGDACIDGIMMMLDTLEQREQAVLNDYYRHGKTLEQIGAEIGLTKVSAGRICKKAILKLRHPSRVRHISRAKMAADGDGLAGIVHCE